MYGLQHEALAHTKQQAIKGPKITSVKPFKLENQQSNPGFPLGQLFFSPPLSPKQYIFRHFIIFFAK